MISLAFPPEISVCAKVLIVCFYIAIRVTFIEVGPHIDLFFNLKPQLYIINYYINLQFPAKQLVTIIIEFFSELNHARSKEI